MWDPNPIYIYMYVYIYIYYALNMVNIYIYIYIYAGGPQGSSGVDLTLLARPLAIGCGLRSSQDGIAYDQSLIFGILGCCVPSTTKLPSL